MLLLELTLPTCAENLALDEALLEAGEQGELPGETLRIWESPQLAVVIGRSSKRSEEADLAYCDAHHIPVLRRSSGGAAIVMGPGCLMYAVVLSLAARPELRMIDLAHQFVLGRIRDALAAVCPNVELCGISDLAVQGRKFSGNSLRVRRTHLLYHGTLLYDFPLTRVGACLKTPPRQPDYRAGRTHGEFVANLKVAPEDLRRALVKAFDAERALSAWPQALTRKLVADKYSQASWNDRLP
jgi:lipoate-protein ligase A